MNSKKEPGTVGTVKALVRPILDVLGLELWDVVFEKEGASWFLRVYIDSPDGISVDQCEAVSRPLSDVLDEKDPIPQSYYLEVGSPGLGRRLNKPEHFQKMMGREIVVKTIRPVDNKREFTGMLKEYANHTVTITAGESILSFPVKQCSYIKLNDDAEIGGIDQ